MQFSKSSASVALSFLLILISSIILYIVKFNPFQNKDYPTLASDVQNIEKFCLAQNCFSKIDGVWFINQTVPADLNQIEDFLSKLKNTRLDTIVSNNPDNFESLGISPDMSISLSIGDSHYQISSNLIKPQDQNIVYKVDFWGNVSTMASVDYWQLKYIQNIPQYQITSIKISTGDLVKNYGKDDIAMIKEDVLSTVAYLKATQYIGNDKPSTLKEYQLISTLEDGNQSTITFGSSGDRVYWASYNQNFYYKISKLDFDKLTSLLK